MDDKARPLISIIIPTRNMAGKLEQCLAAIVELVFEDIEIIVIDGGSEDRTSSVLKRYSTHISRWLSEPDNGIYDALNKGCKMARGQFYYFLGSDDRILKGFNDALKYLIDRHTIYYGDVILNLSQVRYDGPFSLYKIARTNISHQAIFYPRAVFDQYQFSLRYPIQADWELNMRLWNSTSFKFRYIDIPVALFAEEGLSSSREDAVFNDEYLNLVRNIFPWHVYIYRKMLLSILSMVKLVIPRSLVSRLNRLKLRI